MMSRKPYVNDSTSADLLNVGGIEMHKSPNWLPEELMLALELYMSKDLTWLSRIGDTTPEILTLSRILQNLDFHRGPKPENFRSVGSIRMKLSNFKAIDPQYGKSSLSNTGQLDRDIWKKYQGSYDNLKEECSKIVKGHYIGDYDCDVKDYVSRFSFTGNSDPKDGFEKLRGDVIALVTEFEKVSEQRQDESVKNACKEFLGLITEGPAGQKKHIVHGGINQERVNEGRKIGDLVRTEMARLISKGLSREQFEQLESPEWCRKTFHLGHPLVKEINIEEPIPPQLKDKNGYLRYWKTIYHTDERDFVLCKEWFESNRRYFSAWLNGINNNLNQKEEINTFLEILRYILNEDSNEVSVSVYDIKTHFSDYGKTDSVLNLLLDKGVLSPYQGSLRNLNVDDFELLYDMLAHPENYIEGL